MQLSVPEVITFLAPNFVHADDRGSLTQLVNKGWRQVNYITSKAGAFRGGHYHKNNDELFYVIDGQFNLYLKHEKKELSFSIETKSMFVIHACVVHSFDFTVDSTLIAMYSNGVEEKTGMDIYVECTP